MSKRRDAWKVKQKILGVVGLLVCGGSVAIGVGDALVIMVPVSLALLCSRQKIIY